MNCIKTCAAVVAMALLAGTASAGHLDNPNQLVDPSLEGTLTFDGAPFVGTWEGFSGGTATSAFTTATPRTGAQSLELHITGQTNEFAGAFQDVVFGPSLAGQNAWFSGYHQLAGDAGGSEIRIEWRNSVANTEISRTPNLTTSPVGAGYEEFIVTGAIPAGADSARVVYAIQSFGGALRQSVFVDDLNFNYAPEPTSLTALAFAGMALVRRQRRD